MSDARNRGGSVSAATVAIVGLIAGLVGGWWFAGARSPGPSSPGLAERMVAALSRIDPVEHRRAVADTLRALDAETAPTLGEVFAHLEEQFADRCTTRLVAAAWASLDSAAASEAAVELEPPVLRSHATSGIAYELGLDGRFEEGQALLERLELGRVRNPTAAALAEGVVRSGDVEGAMALVSGRDSTRRNRVIESFVRSFLLHEDVDGLMAWVDGIPSDAPHGLKRAVFALAARWLSSVDPQRAAAWYDAQPEGAAHTRLAHLGIAQEWIEHDPDEAMAWAEPRTPAEDREKDMRRLMKRFTERDATAALEWLNRQEPLGWAAAGIPVVVRAIQKERPADALAWARRIPDEDERDRTTQTVARRWLERDPAAARAWLEQSSLPEPLLEAIAADTAVPAEGGASAEGGTSS